MSDRTVRDVLKSTTKIMYEPLTVDEALTALRTIILEKKKGLKFNSSIEERERIIKNQAIEEIAALFKEEG